MGSWAELREYVANLQSGQLEHAEHADRLKDVIPEQMLLIAREEEVRRTGKPPRELWDVIQALWEPPHLKVGVVRYRLKDGSQTEPVWETWTLDLEAETGKSELARQNPPPV